jgi:GT2 family glycosyltransferase
VPESGWLAAYAGAIHDDCRVYEGKTTCRPGVKSPIEHVPGNETGGYLWSCNMMAQAELFSTLGGFDECFPYACMEDVDFRERLLASGHRFEFVPAAAVNHPPRRMTSAWRLAQMHESEIYYWYKTGQPFPAGPRRLYELAKLRLYHLLRCPFGMDTIRGVALYGLELLFTFFRLPIWEFRYYRKRL